MGRIARLPAIALALIAAAGCHNPLMDKIVATVAQKDLRPAISVSTSAGSISSGGSFGFGTISINTSKDVTFTIENTGSASLSLTDTPKVSIAGTDAALFTVVSDPSTPIPVGSSTTFVLRFLPTTNGAKSATVTIPNNDPANGTFSFTVSGSGSIQAAIRVLQDTTDLAPGTGVFSFARTGLTYSSATVTFTIRNVGTAPLNLTHTPAVQVSGDVSVVSQPISTTIAAGGGTTTFTMKFTPTIEGVRTCTVTIENDDPDRAAFTFTARGVASTVLLPRTGQATSYSSGDDGDSTKGQAGVAWPSPRFTATAKTVIDNLTGLEWAINGNLMGTPAYSSQDIDDSPGDGLVLWQTALSFMPNAMNKSGSQYAGYTDWRLPNRDEMRTLMSYGETAMDTWLSGQGFTNIQLDRYWTSTSYAPSPTSNAWCVRFSDGTNSSNDKTSEYHFVLPVRTSGASGAVRLAKTGQSTSYVDGDDGYTQAGAAPPSPRFVDNTDGTITDNLTGLMWEKAPSTSTFTWYQALGAAGACSTGSHTDWRLPNVNELQSLANAGQTDSTNFLSASGFTNLQSAFYWTSTTRAATTANALYVYLTTGVLYHTVKTGTGQVILVRTVQ